MTVVKDGPDDWLPPPNALEQVPQLAVLVALDRTLEVAACAVQVAHPELAADPECPFWVDPDRFVAETLLDLIDRLRMAITRYRKAICDVPLAASTSNPYDEDDEIADIGDLDDIPF